MSKSTSGFTIVELLIVIVVIAILAAISVVAYNGIQDRAQRSAVATDMRQTESQLAAFFTINESYPTSITDCPTPAEDALCLRSAGGDDVYRGFNALDIYNNSVIQESGYHFSVVEDRAFVFRGTTETSNNSREFITYADFAPYIDKYGIRPYRLSFDIKSADTSQRSSVRVYFQNGSGARYGGLERSITVSTEYTHHSIVFTPALSNASIQQSWLAFFGTYDSGNTPIVKNVRFELAD